LTHDEGSNGNFISLELLDREDTVDIVLLQRCMLVRSELWIRLDRAASGGSRIGELERFRSEKGAGGERRERERRERAHHGSRSDGTGVEEGHAGSERVRG